MFQVMRNLFIPLKGFASKEVKFAEYMSPMTYVIITDRIIANILGLAFSLGFFIAEKTKIF